MLNVIICGAPGCGKGTQSQLIEKKYNLKHLSTGDILRKEISEKTELGMIADSYISKGNLVPDEMIIDILVKTIQNMDEKSNGVILDGFPRTVNQAVALEEMLEKQNLKNTVLIDIHVEQDELVTRLVKRGETSGRKDDNLETIKKRLEIYENQTAPVNNFYMKLNKYNAVNGIGTVEEIFGRLSAVIDSKLS
ncbi:MAG TPA: adenylate kinase [Paludibacter sp.]|nr:adenylate kinase [Paludibacter sp.]